MPRVPEVAGPQVASTALPGVRQETNVTSELLGRGARETEKMGQAVVNTGDYLLRMETKEQLEANQLRVDDALNRVKEQQLRMTFDPAEGFNGIKGEQALNRESGMPLSEEYSTKLTDHVSSIAEGLGNEAQKRAFALRANDIVTQFRGQVMNHESTEFKNYALSVREGTISNRLNEIGKRATDPTFNVDEAITSISAATRDQARLLGKSAEWAEAQTRKMTSNAHALAIQSALEKNNPVFADNYLKKYAGQMDADDILKVSGVIDKQVDARIASATVTKVMTAVAPQLRTSDGDRAFNILLKAESGGQQFTPDGKIVTSVKGAIGIAQVMPTTGPEAAKLAGLEWDEQRFKTDATYNSALGKAYFTRQLQDNQGDLRRAYAAYNGGPGRLQQAVKAAEKSGGDWLAYMPKETQDYVTKNMKAYGTGDGAFDKPTLQDVHAQVRRELGDANPARLKIALDDATHRFTENEKADKQRGEETVANAMRWLDQNGGRFSQMPIALAKDLPPKERDNLIAYGQKLAKGDDITDPAVYFRLSDPAVLGKMTDNEFYAQRRVLSDADFKHFTTQRMAAQGKASNKAEEVNTQALAMVLNNRLQQLKMDPTPKDGSDDAAHVGAIRKFVTDSMLAQQKVSGKQMSDAEVEKHVDALFAKSLSFRSTVLGMETGGRDNVRMMTMKAGDIPSETRAKIKSDFKAAGIENPSDADILTNYWKLKTQSPRPLTVARSGASGNW